MLFFFQGSNYTQLMLEEDNILSYAPSSWQWGIWINYLEFFCTYFPLSPLYLFIQSFVYVNSTRVSVCHTLSYNPKPFYLFRSSKGSSFNYWGPFHLGPVSLWHVPIIVFVHLIWFVFSVLSISLHSATTKCSGFILQICCSTLIIIPFFRDSGSWFLLLNNAIINWLVFFISFQMQPNSYCSVGLSN